MIQSKDTLWISALESSHYWSSTTNVQAWSSGKIANNGEKIILENNYGIVIDHVDLSSDSGWPRFENGKILSLKDVSMDNHFGSNWHYIENKMNLIARASKVRVSKIYPNSAKDWVDIQFTSSESVEITIFSLDGTILDIILTKKVDKGKTSIPLFEYPKGLLIFKIGNKYHRIIHN